MPKSQLFYSTSQAAHLLGVSDDTIRRWASEGRIEFETTPGGQMRIPSDEIRRVKTEGKLLPRGAPSALKPRPGSEAARLAEQLEAERLQWRLERMRRQRVQAEAQARLEELRRRQEAEEAERRQREQEDAERRAREEQERRQSWLRRAARRFEPLPAEERLAALEVFEKRLASLQPLPDDGYLARLQDAVYEAARMPMRVEAENQLLAKRLLSEHRDLEWAAEHADLRDQAVMRMHEALRQLGVETPLGVREAAARRALAPVVAQLRWRQLGARLGEEIDEQLWRGGATAEERGQARQEWERRRAQLPDADEGALRAAANELAQTWLGRIAARRQAEQEMQQREVARLMESVRQSDSRRLARVLLMSIVPDVLKRLERVGELEFEGPSDYRATCETIQSRLEERVAKLLLGGADSLSDDTRDTIEQMVEEELDEVVEPEEED
ncbi:MAG: excisionase family DNA-binding protein [Bryobacterales bacterium]|nr:excisionase family DNA-binding protein [Bryobacterales bacterium]